MGDKKISADYLRRIQENLMNQKKWGSVWVLDKQLEDKSYEIVAVFTTFQEYSDWRSGNMHWLYNARVHEKYSSDSNLTMLLLLKFIQTFFVSIMETDTDQKVLRVLVNNSCKQIINRLEKYGMEKAHYYVMEKEL